MSNYYLDVETTGLNPETSEIITIQYQKIDRDGNPEGDLVILKAWETSEEEILKKFHEVLYKEGTTIWNFIPCGYNLKFEHDFLLNRSMKYDSVNIINISKLPQIDIHPIGIMMNQGNFKGSGLDKISGKEGNGKYVIECLIEKQYDKIESYIKQETREYLKLYKWLLGRMPKLRDEFQESLK